MKIKLICDNKECRSKNSAPYVYQIEAEAVMDVKNMATVFCPRCHHTLHPQFRREEA